MATLQKNKPRRVFDFLHSPSSSESVRTVKRVYRGWFHPTKKESQKYYDKIVSKIIREANKHPSNTVLERESKMLIHTSREATQQILEEIIGGLAARVNDRGYELARRVATKYALDAVNYTGTAEREYIHKLIKKFNTPRVFNSREAVLAQNKSISTELVTKLGSKRAGLFLKRYATIFDGLMEDKELKLHIGFEKK